MYIDELKDHVQDIHRNIEVMLTHCTTDSDRDFLFRRQSELMTWFDKFDRRHWMFKEIGNGHGDTSKQRATND